MSTIETNKPQFATPPQALMPIMNTIMGTILRTPLHGLMSKELTILSFTGRKSGKNIKTPVGYMRQGNTLLTLTHRPWWKNIRHNPNIEVLLDGRWQKARAEVIFDDKDAVAQDFTTYLQTKPRLSKLFNIRMDNNIPNPDDVRNVSNHIALIKIHL